MKIDVLLLDRYDLRRLPFRSGNQVQYTNIFVNNFEWEDPVYIALFDHDDRTYGDLIIDWIFDHDREDIMWAYWTIGLIFFKGEALAIDFKLVFSDYV